MDIIPEDRGFNAKIDVCEHIAESGDLLPVGPWITIPEIFGQILYCFPDDLLLPR